MDTKTLVVGQHVSMTSGIYSTEGKVVKVTPYGVEVELHGGIIRDFNHEGEGQTQDGTKECGPWYIVG